MISEYPLERIRGIDAPKYFNLWGLNDHTGDSRDHDIAMGRFDLYVKQMCADCQDDMELEDWAEKWRPRTGNQIVAQELKDALAMRRMRVIK